jgi:hypothetical protein
MSTVTVESTLFDQVWQPALAWRSTSDHLPRGKARLSVLSPPRPSNLRVAPARRREEHPERWDGLA